MSLDGPVSRISIEARRRTDFGYGHPMTERLPLEASILERVHASFARQGAMATLGAELADVAAGHVAIVVPVEPRLSQQHGFLHAGVVIAALDTACGYAALTLMPDDADVLTVELKVNLLAPAIGDRIVADGEVVRAGGTLTVCRGDAYGEQGSERSRGDHAGHHGASARRLTVAHPAVPTVEREGALVRERSLAWAGPRT